MKLNAAMQKNDHARIRETFQEIEGLNLTSQEKADISLRGFYYFLPKRCCFDSPEYSCACCVSPWFR